MQNTFNDELTKHSLLPLQGLDASFPRDAQKAYQAYAQSWKLVSYMYATFGLKKMAALIQATHSTDQSFDSDLQKSLGVDSSQLENQWHLRLNQPATLSGTQQTQQPATPAVDSKPVVAADTSDSYLIAAGGLLIVVPLLGGIALLVFVLINRRKVRAQAALQQVPNSMYPGNYINYSGPDRQQPNHHYSQPSAYSPAGPYGPAEQYANTANSVPPSYSAYQPYPWGNPEVTTMEEPKLNIEE
ncbi:hypothetical protein KDK_16880 [Dictyobacter kobayashii]|uniref:Peptidase MA-like domain-containing protein n=2 Tax=Dictyobacter kobayashii TaxID=2014872 RepID=A0A402AFJ5_9CHLR|nr:hypothetical protein KDK_16880 [Dictyobacter kobayashii]